MFIRNNNDKLNSTLPLNNEIVKTDVTAKSIERKQQENVSIDSLLIKISAYSSKFVKQYNSTIPSQRHRIFVMLYLGPFLQQLPQLSMDRLVSLKHIYIGTY